jgi:elongation factor Ts
MNIQKVIVLREKTNAPLSIVKRALADFNDDEIQAEAQIRGNWIPPDKEANCRTIVSYVHNGRIGVMFEICCGTDFLVKSDKFQNLCKEISFQLTAGLPGELEEQEWVKDSSYTVGDLIKALSAQAGETIKVTRHVRWTV